MSTDVDTYFANAKRWQKEAKGLRAILLDCGLERHLRHLPPHRVPAVLAAAGRDLHR